MQDVQQYKPSDYNPLKWPPDFELAKLHLKCVCPGKDNPEGAECPCCGRLEKIQVKNWYSRNLYKDLKNYGGGIASYFSLMKYCALTMFILAIIIIQYHIYILEVTCPVIKQTLMRCQNISAEEVQRFECTTFLFVFKFCRTKTILETLNCNNEWVKSYIFFYLQLGSFIYLIVATIGMKLWIQRVNNKKIIKQESLYAPFSLILKNIPKFYQLDDIHKQLQEIVPAAQICQLFFVYQISQLQNSFKKLFDLHFVIQFTKQSIANDSGETLQHLQKLIAEYKQLYDKTMELKKNLVLNNGRAIAVFNKIQQRDMAYKALKINQCSKLVFHTMKFAGMNTRKLHFFADKLPQPKEILWKYIGESSVTKTWVRIKTSLIGFGFMILAFLLLYFPIIEIDEQNIKKHSAATSVLSLIISLLLQILSIAYRLMILRILPSRHPSSRQAESHFVVMTTVAFHFFFYIVAPGTYYEVARRIPDNIKLKQLFVAVFLFLIMTVIVAVFDLRYRLFNSRRKKTMSKRSEWAKLCQSRLHQQIRYPSFPIQFKLMVLLDIWSFCAFYIFQIPYLLAMFVVVITIVYWNDKRNIYKHYKMQVFQSIDVEISVQRDYNIMFLICVCCGYAVCAIQIWQYYVIGAVAIVSLLINFIISYQTTKKNKTLLQKTMTLNEVIKAHSIDAKLTPAQNIFQTQLKQNAIAIGDLSSVSLGSSAFHYGYKQLYQTYLGQFKNKQILKLLQQTYHEYRSEKYDIKQQINEIKRKTQLEKGLTSEIDSPGIRNKLLPNEDKISERDSQVLSQSSKKQDDIK